MAFSTSASIASLFLVATICCSNVNAAEWRPALPSVVDRQSKQVYVAPHQFYNYYNPYEYQMLLQPTAEGEIDSKLTSDGSESDTLQGRQNLPITVAPATTECLITANNVVTIATSGLGGCTKGSQAASGNIDLTFSAGNQGVVIALVPNPRRYSKVKITCSEITAGVKAFTKNAKIAFTTDTPVTETKQTQIFVVGGKAADKFKCSWEAS